MTIVQYNNNSLVEKYFSEKTAQPSISPEHEKVKTFCFPNYIELGKSVALRFLEWAANNPEGLISLPTGKTPEFFIKWTQYYLENWKKECSKGILAEIGLKASQQPDLRSLNFVMIDEFFPMDPKHERSFNWFVNNFYINGFHLDPANCMLIDTYTIRPEMRLPATIKNMQDIFPDGKIDLTLRTRHTYSKAEELQKQIIRYFDQFCEDYEERIRQLGGIGFFLGGIGPDGHIAFNVRGSSHHSPTRLTNINYETQAAAAVDLGGIESVRRKAVITIGLETIIHNPDVCAIIMAAGESKSGILASSIENKPSLDNPSSVLQKIQNSRFYLTQGASSKLQERKKMNLLAKKDKQPATIDKLVIDGLLKQQTSLMQLLNTNPNEIKKDNSWLLAEKITGKNITDLAAETYKRLCDKIERGIQLPKNVKFLHTGPHHDDVELAYFPLLHHLVRSEFNENHFVYCTSGFTSVTNDYVLQKLVYLHDMLISGRLYYILEKESVKDYKQKWDDITGTLNVIAGQDKENQDIYLSSRLARLLFRHLSFTRTKELTDYLEQVIERLKNTDPGARDEEIIKHIKGWIREFEAELVWAHFGIGINHVHHLRLQFYTGDIFVEYPDFERDVKPIMDLLDNIRPTIITLALDPEGSGPDTHLKTLIALYLAIDKYVEKHKDKNIRIWGYRNIWSKFHPADVGMIVPVSLNSFAVLHNMFNNCFLSQKSASFPSYEHDGTFSELAQKIWVEQHAELIKIMGNDYFYDNPNPMMKRSYGAIYIKDMSYREFLDEIGFIDELINAKKELNEL